MGGGAGEAPRTTVFNCPNCRWSGEFDSRFTAWCGQCGYNADPAAGKTAESPRALRRKQRERVRAEQLFDSLRDAQDLRPTSAVGLAVTAVATLVHLLTLTALAGSVWLIATWPHLWSAWVAGLLGIAVAIEVRPRIRRFVRSPKEEGWLTRDAAPALFAVVDRCADALDAPRVDRIRFIGAFNAFTTTVGWRRRVRLMIGVPLWRSLTGPERVALLGHELGHQINGDVLHGFWAASARESLARWMRVLDPRQTAYEQAAGRRVGRTRGAAGLASLLAPVLTLVMFGPLFLIALGCDRILRRLDLLSGQRAEYLADEMAARLGSSAAAVAIMERFSLGESVQHFLRQAKHSPQEGDPFAALTQYLDSVPDHEKRRRLLLQELHNTRVDRTHPANYLRRKLLLARPPRSASVEVTDAEWAAVDAELIDEYVRVARRELGIKPNRRPIPRQPGQAPAAAGNTSS
jgi:Zn-dependent protease with chaperone function